MDMLQLYAVPQLPDQQDGAPPYFANIVSI